MTAYFDNAATTKVCPEAANAVMDAMIEDYGNPSSGYALGRRAAQIITQARERVAQALRAETSEVFFTSGGTEGDNWALRSGAWLSRHSGRHIVTGAAEHDAVRKTAQSLQSQGWEVTFIKPDRSGRVNVEDVMRALRDDTVLVSLMLVNNETGAMSPIQEIARAVKGRCPKALIHTDAVQAFLKVPFSPKELGVDLATISSHKIHGPKGAGALYIRRGLRLPQLMTGGGQESGYRPGTEPVPAIVGFGAAADVGYKNFAENTAHIREMRTRASELLRERAPDIVEIGQGDAPQILNVSFPGYRSEVIINVLDAAGISAAKGSACRRGARSHVLEAMGLPSRIIDGAIRLSFSRYTTIEEVDYFVDVLTDALSRLSHR